MKIIEILKKFSFIDSSFIYDFYSFYDEGKSEYDYTINLELIAKWLDIKKGHLKDLLKSNFQLFYIYSKYKNVFCIKDITELQVPKSIARYSPLLFERDINMFLIV